MPSFKSFVDGSAAVTLADADQVYVYDDGSDASTKITWANLKATALASPTLTGTVAAAGATAVTVPDATADGEAIAYDQASWQLGTGTFTGDVAIVENSPSIIIDDANGTADQSKYRINVATSQFAVALLDDASALVATPFKLIAPTNQVDMTGATSVTVPDVADGDTTTAAQSTARTAALGRMAINGIELGDTGWRDISGSIANGWTCTRMIIRRSGNTVFLKGLVSGAAKTSDALLSLPSGFAATNSHTDVLAANSGAATYLAAFASGANVTSPSTGTMYFSGSWGVLGAWPSSLPGTQVTAPL